MLDYMTFNIENVTMQSINCYEVGLSTVVTYSTKLAC